MRVELGASLLVVLVVSALSGCTVETHTSAPDREAQGSYEAQGDAAMARGGYDDACGDRTNAVLELRKAKDMSKADPQVLRDIDAGLAKANQD